MIKKMFLAICLMVFAISVNAQEKVIKGDFHFSQEVGVISLLGEVSNYKTKAEIRQYSFGEEGNTIVGTMVYEGKKHSVSISGHDVMLMKTVQNGATMYVGANTQGKMAIVLGQDKQGSWLYLVTDQISKMVGNDIHQGMTVQELQDVTADLGLSKIKLLRTENGLKVYQLLWLDMQKRYHWFGNDDYHYELTNDKEYGRFYFDASGKLVKWLIH